MKKLCFSLSVAAVLVLSYFSGHANAAISPGSVTYTIDATTPTHENYPDNTGSDLSNGTIGAADFGDADWVAWYGDAKIVFDLGSSKTLTSIVINYMNNAGAAISGPSSVAISFSTDGTTFDTPVSYSDFDLTTIGVLSKTISLSSVNARYVKMQFTAAADSFLFLSEVTFSDEVVTPLYAIDPTTPVYYLYPDDGQKLRNGVFGPANFQDSAWVAWTPSMYEPDTPSYAIITFDMTTGHQFSSVDIGYLSYPNAGIYAPNDVEVSFSDDGTTFTTPQVLTGFTESVGCDAYSARRDLGEVWARYAKFKVYCGSHDPNHWLWLSEFKFHFVGEVSYMIDSSTLPVNRIDDTGNDLHNGISAPFDLANADWVQWSPDAWTPAAPPYAIITFDLTTQTTLQGLGMTYTNAPSWGVWAPGSLEASLSNDGVNYDTPRVFTSIDRSAMGAFASYFDMNDATGRYLKLKVNCYDNDPSKWFILSEFNLYYPGDVIYTIDSNTPPIPWRADNSGRDLYNGVIADANVDNPDWIQWAPDYSGTPEYAIINFDLLKTRNLESVDVTYFSGFEGAWGVEAPANMELSYSADGITFTTPVTITGFERSSTQIYTTNFTLDVNGVRYIKAKVNTYNHKWMFLSEFKFNDQPLRKGDFDASGNVDLADLAIFAGEWLDSGTVVHSETAVLEDFESYASQEDLVWFEYPNSTGTSSLSLLTTSADSHSGSKALRWGYNVSGSGYLWSEIQYLLPAAVNLSQYDIVHVWLKRDAGNSTEQSLYVKFFNDGVELANIAGETALTAAQGSTSSPTGEWSEWLIDLHNLDYTTYAGPQNGYTNLAQITNMKAFLIGTLGFNGSTGFINVDDIVLEKGQLCDGNFTADLNGDCKVDFTDFSKFAVNWLFAN